MPRGKKNEEVVEETVAAETEVTVEAAVSVEEAEAPVEENPAETVESAEVAVEVVEESAPAETEKQKEAVESTAATEAVEDVGTEYQIGSSLTGSFKVYRGRNLATITSLAAVVIVNGDVITENDVKWLPVQFNNKTGKLAFGFIVVK